MIPSFADIANLCYEGLLKLFQFLDVFLYWGCKYVLVVCTIVYFSSRDKRAIHQGVKIFFIYFTFCLFRSVIL